jgi:hypothetical protein
MGLFEKKADKQEIQLEEFKNKYLLNNLNKEELTVLSDIHSFVHKGRVLQSDTEYMGLPLYAIVKQNHMIIDKLAEISKKLDK